MTPILESNPVKLRQEVIEVPLKRILQRYIDEAFKKPQPYEEWSVSAVDVVRDKVIFSRYVKVKNNED